MSRAETLPGVPYGRMDRLVHRLAFASLDAQRGLGQAESRIFAAELPDDAARRPVFVTSLPRAGTTVLLEALAGLPDFATATYRHMPFTLAPLIWQRFARGFGQRDATSAERAHGDGIAVGVDSPEAFEETLWMAFWPEHYRGGTIRPWPADAEATDFAGFFRRHMAKIVALGGGAARRYLSKNNANIARLGLIARLFPDASIVVPVRHPFAQAASLLRQHRRFTELHARDRFARRYMEGLGHFEFGAALRPIAFAEPSPDPAVAGGIDFWLAYWVQAYEAVLATAGPQVTFVDHDALSAAPEPVLAPLAEALGLSGPDALVAAGSRFRPSPPASVPDGASPLLVARAEAVHAALRRRCLDPAIRPTRTEARQQ